MAEYVMHPGDDPVEVVRALLNKAEAPEHVVWAPRADVPGGGVYVVRDEATVAEVSRAMQAKRDEEAKRIADAQAAADERDAKADETGLTPSELGFPASTGSDPGAAGTEGVQATPEAAVRGDGLLAPELVENPDGTLSSPEQVEAENGDDADNEPTPDDPDTPDVDESKQTPAQKRATKKAAAAATQEETK